MAVTRGREEPQVFGGDCLPFPLQLGNHFLHVDRVPNHEQIREQVQAAHGFLLLLVLLAPQGPVTPKPKPAAQRVQLLAFVELRVNTPTQGLALQVAQNEVGFQQPAMLLQQRGELVLRG